MDLWWLMCWQTKDCTPRMPSQMKPKLFRVVGKALGSWSTETISLGEMLGQEKQVSPRPRRAYIVCASCRVETSAQLWLVGKFHLNSN